MSTTSQEHKHLTFAPNAAHMLKLALVYAILGPPLGGIGMWIPGYISEANAGRFAGAGGSFVFLLLSFMASYFFVTGPAVIVGLLTGLWKTHDRLVAAAVSGTIGMVVGTITATIKAGAEVITLGALPGLVAGAVLGFAFARHKPYTVDQS